MTEIEKIPPDYLYYTLLHKKQSKEIELLTVGAVQAKLPIYNIQSMSIIIPDDTTIKDFQRHIRPFSEKIKANTLEIQKLYKIQEYILSNLSN